MQSSSTLPHSSSPNTADIDETSSPLPDGPHDQKPMLRLYFWKNRGLFNLFGMNITVGHVAIDIKVPLNWYAHRITKTSPVNVDGLLPSYTLYKDEKEKLCVFIVHCDQISEVLSLTEKEDDRAYLQDTPEIATFLSEHLHQETASLDVRFPEQLSERIAAFSRYRHDHDYCYLSFSPENSAMTGTELFKTTGECLARETEWKNEGAPDEVMNVDGLNHVELYTTAIRLRNRIDTLSAEEFAQSIQWGVWRDNQTCSSLVLSLLGKDKVGAIKRAPAFGRLGTLQSIILLSLRPVLTTAVLFPMCYDLIVDGSSLVRVHPYRHHHEHDSAHDTVNLMTGSTVIFLLVPVLLAIEKFSARYITRLQATTYRKRELVEIRPVADFLIQWLGFSSIPILSLWWNFQVFERYVEEDRELSLVADAGIAALIAVSTYLIVTLLTSKLIDLCQHCCFQTPAVVREMADFIGNTKEIPESLLVPQFKKEWALNLMTLLSLLANIVMLRYATFFDDDFSNQPFFLAVSGGLFLSGYSLSKALIVYFDRQQQHAKSLLEASKPVSESALQQLQSHDPKPELFAVTAFFSSTAMLISADRIPGDWPFAVSLSITIGATILAYFLSLIFYDAAHRVCQAVFSMGCPSLFTTSRASLREEEMASLTDEQHQDYALESATL